MKMDEPGARQPATRGKRSTTSKRKGSTRLLDSEWKLAYTMQEAAEATGLSVATLHRAIHTTDWASFPPPLYGKRAGGRYLVLKTELERWLTSFPEA